MFAHLIAMRFSSRETLFRFYIEFSIYMIFSKQIASTASEIPTDNNSEVAITALGYREALFWENLQLIKLS